MKLSSRNLNSSPCPLYLTNTYTCGMTITTRVYGSENIVVNYSTIHASQSHFFFSNLFVSNFYISHPFIFHFSVNLVHIFPN